MKPTIRQTADGIELFDGDNQRFRAWPLTWWEASELGDELLFATLKHSRDEEARIKKEKQAKRKAKRKAGAK